MRSLKISLIYVVFCVFFCAFSLGCGETSEKPTDAAAPFSTDIEAFDLADYAGFRASAGDPLSAYQWHLKNFGQLAGKSGVHAAKIGADLNVTPLFERGVFGAGSRVAIVDTGVEITHPDLAANIDLAASVSYIGGGAEPREKSALCAHGTGAAGLAAAAINNGGVVGVAPKAKIAAINIGLGCGGNAYDSTLLSAFMGDLEIYSNSWGYDDFFTRDRFGEALAEGVRNGRNGRGSLYFFAAGNSRSARHRADYNEHLSNFEVMPIAALESNGAYAPYSAAGANILVSAFGGANSLDKALVVTTALTGCEASKFGAFSHELNAGCAYGFMNGTSAATPQAAGAAALILEARRDLSWREARYILAASARQNDPREADWTRNGAGFWINHNYGFGAIDAFSAVQMAKNFRKFGALKSYERNDIISADFLAQNDINKIEFVNVSADINNARNCSFNLALFSPAGTIAEFVKNDIIITSDFTLRDFVFGTPRFLDENANGIWQLAISDSSCNNLSLESWSISIKGRSE
ncbi:MAG: S8 family serine peptidase [Helicobacteraceae bacterium]|jgi:hypothetical protein|nr:S8 family serine peptidase [Helicobacteraceae bacterium]